MDPSAGSLPAQQLPAPVSTQGNYQSPGSPLGALTRQPVMAGQMLNPKRMLWAGTLADIGAFIANPFSYNFQGLGPQYMMQAEQWNQSLQNNQMALRKQEQDYQTGTMQQDVLARNLRQEENPYGQFPAQEQEYRQWLKSSGMPDSAEARAKFADYARSMGLSGNASQRPTRTWIGEDGNMMYLSATGEVVNTSEKGSPPGEKIIEVAGAPYVQRQLPGGEVETVPLDQWQDQYRRSSMREDTMSESMNKTDSDFRDVITNTVPELQQSIANIDELSNAIENGHFTATGPAEGLYKKYTNPETAQLEAKSVYQALLNLQITKLTPVSNYEIGMIKSLYADIGLDPDANLAILKEAKKILTDKLAILEDKYKYASQNNMSLRGYNETIKWPGSTQFKVTGDPVPE